MDSDEDSKPEPESHAIVGARKLARKHMWYYATIIFNQIVLIPDDRGIVLKLINVYFEIFMETLGEGNIEDADDDELDDEVGKEKDDCGEILKNNRGRVINLGEKNEKEKRGKSLALLDLLKWKIPMQQLYLIY